MLCMCSCITNKCVYVHVILMGVQVHVMRISHNSLGVVIYSIHTCNSLGMVSNTYIDYFWVVLMIFIMC